ncbi:hypothetical protein [Nostoc sp. C110]|uniref:hypothetical protein n=1 Tax=Nostoc sp. C110 TaxID=3349876 RepID=UPI00370D31C9
MQNFDERAKQGKPSCFADPEGAIWLMRGVRRAFLYDETIRSDNSHTDTSRNSGAYIYSIMSRVRIEAKLLYVCVVKWEP